MAVVPLVEKARVPFVSLGGAVVIIEPVKKWVFKTSHTDRMACERIFSDMRNRKIERIGLISGTGGFDKSMRAECLKVAPNYKVSIIADETFGDGDSDMTAQLVKIKNTPGVQAMLSTGY
jgi:branched-chain amino acid transport system substrate-binding protein